MEIRQTMGVSGPFGGVFVRILAQFNQALFDFSDLCMELLTNAYGGLLVMAIGLTFRDMWQA